ncbi:hypothetical protein PV325_010567 [Microctonus aethiopoides]|uniref:Kinesin motor domain-containing protein n=1 Tax=Microctonus aethiopoides TaxID=144406 RepID=A0AA39C4X2_9HYME|nr:hypothetical protein PV325_010567 [Microctonus aethiopoides]KAK0157971.1 hypothetical protein PV328_011647 [Microctonus aethiopoides]
MSANMSDVQGRKREKNQHIQVFVRVRPPNQSEMSGKSLTVVDVPTPRECVVRERPQDKHTKKFTFDRVFGPSSKQLDVYNAVVSPLLDEVLAGYNCTVFAYGQTGTGKTFTMEGLSNDPAIHWQSDTTAGIIPRSLSHLFDELRMLESQEYTVRVSFLELYNEELFDLLSPNDDASKIRLYEDASKKGAVIIHGLEEVTVHNKNEVYKILEKGSEKRQTAATLMNAQSSRSHTVFSVTVHIKENTVDGEELLKTGKLNLVDLAGSENVGRSGAVDRRAREAGNINQSLLTLGRVITALVERAPHIPYRESKLTRLLQESLGGRTKTSIIATISPASINLEETLSTLDYAHRAKNITNRPEINQKMSKKALLKEYTEEIERLRRDLQATRERNGVYLAHDNYNEMQMTIEFQGKEIEEKLNHIKALEETMAAKEKLLEELKIDLAATKHQVEITEQEKNEQRHLVETHVKTERKLLHQAKSLLKVAEIASSDTYKLHNKIERKNDVEMNNKTVGDKFQENISKQVDDIQNELSSHTEELMKFYSFSESQICNQKDNDSEFFADSVEHLSRNLIEDKKIIINDLTKNINASRDNYEKWFNDEINNAQSLTNAEREVLKKLSVEFSSKISQLVNNKIENQLRIIDQETTKNLIKLRDFTKSTIGNLINALVEERNLLKKDLETVSNNLAQTQKSMDEMIAKRKEHTENIYRAVGMWYDEEVQRDNNIIKFIQSGDNKCKSANIHIDKISEKQGNIKSFIDDDLCVNATAISGKLSQELEKNCNLIENTIKQSDIINSDLKKEFEKHCQFLTDYTTKFETRSNKYKEQIKSDCDETLSLITKDWKNTTKTIEHHVEITENHRKKSDENFTNINNQMQKQKSDTINWNQKITTHLAGTKHEIERFLTEDLKRDEPTGSTPVKKEFSYPRQLVTTSPHERILNRYRQQTVNESRFENSLINNSISMRLHSPIDDTIRNDPILSSTPIAAKNTKENYSTTSESINDNDKIITENSTQLIRKSVSASNITAIVDNIQIESKSESEIFNKENGENEITGFAKPSLRQPKHGTKLRSGNGLGKRILTSRNE